VLRFVFAATLLSFTPHSLAQGTADSGAAAGSAAVSAGKIELIEGDVRFVDKDGRARRPKSGDVLYEGESVVTGADGETQLSMEDGGYLGIRPNTNMRIVSYKAEGGSEDKSVIGLLQGSFRSVTGWIAKLGGSHYVVRTPTATIGVRGTEHEPLVIPEGSKEGEPGTYDRVHIGESVIQSPQGAVSVRSNQAGFVPGRGAVRPRVLDRIPAFFRPTRNEGRFAGLHARIQTQLGKRREERRRFIEQRRRQRIEQQGESRPAIERRQEQRKFQQERRREQSLNRREERGVRAGKTGIERAQKQQGLQERRREADGKQRSRRAAKAEEHGRPRRARKSE